jgi:hypothetical protein
MAAFGRDAIRRDADIYFAGHAARQLTISAITLASVMMARHSTTAMALRHRPVQ